MAEDKANGNAAEGLLKPGGKFGDYDVVRRIGRGGMAEVYLIRSARTGAVFAVKILAPVPEEERSESRLRFAREAESAMRVVHPNLVRVYDWGEDPETGLCYIIMDYMGGGTLAQKLAAHGSLPVGDAVSTAARLASALAAAHEHGIVHRDIKPDNIIFDESGTPKILDLGIAKVAGEKDVAARRGGRASRSAHPSAAVPEVTMAGTMIGTPAYMAPEQVEDSHSVDARADIYSLGVVFYEMLSGTRPNPDDTIDELLEKALQGTEIADIRISMPEVSTPLAKVVSRMCAPRRESRPESAREVVRMLMETPEGKCFIPPEIAKTAEAPSADSPASGVERTLIRRPTVLDFPQEIFGADPPAQNGGQPGLPDLFPVEADAAANGNGEGFGKFARKWAAVAVAAVIGALSGLVGGFEIGRSFGARQAPSVSPVDSDRAAFMAAARKTVTITNEVVETVTVTVTNFVDLASRNNQRARRHLKSKEAAASTPAPEPPTPEPPTPEPATPEPPTPTPAPASAPEPPVPAVASQLPAPWIFRKDMQRLGENALFPGWNVTLGHGGKCNAYKVGDGHKILVTLPGWRDESVTMSNPSVAVPAENPVLHIRVASHSPDAQFRLRVNVDGDKWHTDIIDGWNDICLPLDKWRGKKVHVKIQQEPTGWNDEIAYWEVVEVVSNGELYAQARRQSKVKQRKIPRLAIETRTGKLTFEDTVDALYGSQNFKFQTTSNWDWGKRPFYDEEYLNRYDCLVLHKSAGKDATLRIIAPKTTTREMFYNPHLSFAVASDGNAKINVKVFVKNKCVVDEIVSQKKWKDFMVDLNRESQAAWAIDASIARVEISCPQNSSGAMRLEGVKFVDMK